MTINALIAQGIRPIGEDIPQILMQRQQNALAERTLDSNIQQDQQRNALYERQIGVQERGQQNTLDTQSADRQSAASAALIDHMRRNPGNVAQIVQLGKQNGIIPPEVPDQLSSEQIEMLAARAGLPPMPQPFTQESGPRGSILQRDPNTGELKQVVGPDNSQAAGPAKPNWQRVDQPMPDGKIQTGFVDMNSSSPDQTFRPFGSPAAGKPGQEMKDATSLRKEFDSQPIVKDYRQVITLYQRASTAPNTRAGDLSVVYALGKIFDPGSVVREGELQMSANAAPWLQKTLGQAQSQIKGSGALEPAVRAELLAAMRGQVDSIGQQYGELRQQYGEYAKNYSVDPNMVIGQDPTPQDQGAPSGGPPPDIAALLQQYGKK